MTIFLSTPIFIKQRILKIGVLGLYRFWRFWRFWQISGFPGFGQIRGFLGRVPVPARSRDLAGSAKSGVFRGPRIRGFRGPESGFSGVPDPGKKHTFRDDGFSCIEQLGPGFWTFFSKSNEIWGPGPEKSGSRDPEIWPFSGSRGPRIRGPDLAVFGVRGQISGFPGFVQISGISGFWLDFGILGTLGPQTGILGS